MSELTLSDALKLWIAHGGSTFGPRVEHVSMKESDFLGFCLALRAHPVEAGEVVAESKLPTNESGTAYVVSHGQRMPAYQIGTEVQKHDGYPFPGEVRSAFTTRAGALRYVVEATGAEYATMLHIFSPVQLAAAPIHTRTP